jgi:hypothetical protein
MMNALRAAAAGAGRSNQKPISRNEARQVGREHQAEHRPREQRQEPVVPGEAGIARHVAQRVHHHREGDGGYDQGHGGGERVKQDAEGEPRPVGYRQPHRGRKQGRVRHRHRGDQVPRSAERDGEREDGERGGRARAPPESEEDHGARGERCRLRDDGGGDGPAHPFCSDRRSTSISCAAR